MRRRERVEEEGGVEYVGVLQAAGGGEVRARCNTWSADGQPPKPVSRTKCRAIYAPKSKYTGIAPPRSAVPHPNIDGGGFNRINIFRDNYSDNTLSGFI